MARKPKATAADADAEEFDPKEVETSLLQAAAELRELLKDASDGRKTFRRVSALIAILHVLIKSGRLLQAASAVQFGGLLEKRRQDIGRQWRVFLFTSD